MNGSQTSLVEQGGVRVAIQGCGHGQLNTIYKSVQGAALKRGWDTVDLVIVGGDFQAVRNAADLTVMAVPMKYRKLGDFPEYYSGRSKAPFLTVFIGGNHEAISHMWELAYGGWVAPNIYYFGFANVLRLGPIRIAGMSGIWKGPDHYHTPHSERLPFSHDDIKSFYHVREFDVRKLLQVKEQVDICLSHDWPEGIEDYGDAETLFKQKPHFRQSSMRGNFGNPAATHVLDRLRPAHWFSAHMHCKFTALKQHSAVSNKLSAGNIEEEDLFRPEAMLLASPDKMADSSKIPGQPVPSSVFNTETQFMALDKCQPEAEHLELRYIMPLVPPRSKISSCNFKLEYDPEWLAITRVFHPHLTIGDPDADNPVDEGEEAYAEMISRERVWVDKHVVDEGKLMVPENFTITAPVHKPEDPSTTNHQPKAYTNPQMVAFCELLDIQYLWAPKTLAKGSK
ncbi:lariat debranching enzyme, C-terminal domain-containing protein [Xylariaceae sp. FL1019]|nr:lariat debranching enzyme, C-terminal domain-containing protein [Xylariaceae sp. FL1019]